jgi:putative C-S lyase
MAAAPTVGVSSADYLYFVERAVGGMAVIVADLGDDLACTRPDLPGANSAYGLLTHCLGVIRYWGGRLVAGREIERDREREFEATGSVTDLLAETEAVLAQLRIDIETVDSEGDLAREPDVWAQGPGRKLNQGAALLHLYEEMAQHHGQMEVLRDLLRKTRPGRPFAADLGWLRAKHGVKWRRPGPDLIPAWVADMDFPVAAPIRAAIEATVDRGDLGYPDWPEHPLAAAFSERMLQRYGWAADPGHVRGLTDLIQGLQLVIELATEPGQAVVAHTPNYPPFLATVPTTGRRLLAAQLHPNGDSWAWDHDRLDAELRIADARVLLLVNPHNPTGRVFTRAELEQVAELAERHDLIVISDEIHAELTFEPYQHVPFATLSPETAARTVTITSATKAFNIAGLRTAVAHVGPARLRAAWDAAPPDLYGATNVLGVEATLAAWRDGDPWLAGLRGHLADQRRQLDRLATLPGLVYRPPEATYLAWLDLTEAGLPGDPAAFLRAKAGIELSPGADFGPGSAGFARLNFATSATVLNSVLDRIETALTAQ